MKGLDLSKLHKISSDGKSTTFKHVDGHELKIAHAGLSPKMLAELQKLPVHRAEGEPNPEPNQSPNDQDPNAPTAPGSDTGLGSQPPATVININPSPQPNQSVNPPPAAPAPVQLPGGGIPQPNGGMSGQQLQDYIAQNPGPPATTGFNPSNAAANAPMQPMDNSSPAPISPDQSQEQAPPSAGPGAPQEQAPAQGAEPQRAVASNLTADSIDQYKQTVQANMLDEDKKWENDLANGHITPQTYGSLFHNAGTLGKIGMIFGMLASGAGSGLAHQQNAFMAMMNQQIQNDLEAQKVSKQNAYNFLNLNREHQLNQAQAGLMGKQGELAGAQAENQQLDAAQKAWALSNMQMNKAALHAMVLKMQKLPPGSPEQIRTQQALAMMNAAVQSENYNIADRAAAASAWYNMPMGAGQGGAQGGNGAIDYSRMNQLERASQMKIPGAPSEQDMGEMTKEATKVEENRATQKVFNDSFAKLNSMALAGKLSPNVRAAEVNALSGQLAHQTVNRYNKAEADNQAEGMFPQATDWPSTRDEKQRKADQFFAAQEAGTPTLQRFGVKAAPQPTQAQQPQTQMSKSGRPMVNRGGKWYYQ